MSLSYDPSAARNVHLQTQFETIGRLAAVTISLAAMSCITLFGQAPSRDEGPSLATLPTSVPEPQDNPTAAEKTELGKLLFFDPRLSGSNEMSCATCHLPEKGWGDGLPCGIGDGKKELTRNSQTILNVGFYESLFWDGRVASLEEQALEPIGSTDEMNQDVDELVKELAGIPGYVDRFLAVFGRPINKLDIARALASFQRTIVSRNSPLDRYLSGDKRALSGLAREGLELFQGDAGCSECHNGPHLSDGKFYRIGAGRSPWDDGDAGRAQVTGNRDDRFKFRAPSLRDVANTGPYMHDGSLETLSDVVEYYYRGIPSAGPDGLELDVAPLVGQSFSEIDAVVAFLKALSGEPPNIIAPELP